MPELSDLLGVILTIAVVAVPVLFAITVHEAAHGWVASRRGDNTALSLGRVTFNPLRHIDPVGTVLVPLLILLLAKAFGGVPLLFGWAKPVPVDWRRLHNPRWDMALVAAAGPGANLLMAVGWGLVLQLLLLAAPLAGLPEMLVGALAEACLIGILINLFLMALNLFPLLPLDGGRILNAMLPLSLSFRYSRLEPYGLVILLALLLLPNGDPPGLLGDLLRPVVNGALMLVPGAQLVREITPF
jgi:Zn-dependent protease